MLIQIHLKIEIPTFENVTIFGFVVPIQHKIWDMLIGFVVWMLQFWRSKWKLSYFLNFKIFALFEVLKDLTQNTKVKHDVVT